MGNHKKLLQFLRPDPAEAASRLSDDDDGYGYAYSLPTTPSTSASAVTSAAASPWTLLPGLVAGGGPGGEEEKTGLLGSLVKEDGHGLQERAGVAGPAGAWRVPVGERAREGHRGRRGREDLHGTPGREGAGVARVRGGHRRAPAGRVAPAAQGRGDELAVAVALRRDAPEAQRPVAAALRRRVVPEPGRRGGAHLLGVVGQDVQGVAGVGLAVPRVCARPRRRCEHGGGRGVRRDGVHGLRGRDGQGVAAGGRREEGHEARHGAGAAEGRERGHRHRRGDRGARGVRRLVGRRRQPLAVAARLGLSEKRRRAARPQDGRALPRGGRSRRRERLGGPHGLRVAPRGRRRPRAPRRTHEPHGPRQVRRHGRGGRRGEGLPPVGGVQRQPRRVRQGVARVGQLARPDPRADAGARVEGRAVAAVRGAGAEAHGSGVNEKRRARAHVRESRIA